jgi:hypothetical protein
VLLVVLAAVLLQHPHPSPLSTVPLRVTLESVREDCGAGPPQIPGARDPGSSSPLDPSAGWLGDYAMAREASGTSWQPEAAGMEGLHFGAGAWRGMAHASAFAVYTRQGGPRGGRQAFSTNMAALGAGRDFAGGTLALRAMASLEPLMGRTGYRHLLQTGESADGVNHLIDRQHPHDLAMELAVMYSRPVGARASVFLYGGWPGEPALGPPAFMHRPSGLALPTAPLGHHWMDATHVTFGVVTAGLIRGPFKLDASAFNGREPDGERWGFEPFRLDSASLRLTVNPSSALSVQASAGRLETPERLHPGLDTNRYTASVSWSGGPRGAHLDATAAWARNVRSAHLPNCFISAGCLEGTIPFPPSRFQDALLLEATLRAGTRHLVFTRAERVEKDGLYAGLDPFHARVFPVAAAQLGYLYELPLPGRLGFRVGGAVSLSSVPEFIEPDFGRRPVSYWILAQARLR